MEALVGAIVVAGLEVLFAPRTMIEYQRGLFTRATGLSYQLGSLPEGVWAGSFPYPHTNGNRLGTQIIAFTPYQFQGADQTGCPNELITGQQTQGVAHQNNGATPGIGMTKAPKYNLKGEQAKVGFGLAAACREPDQIDRVTENAVLIRCGFQRGQQEGQLERTPTIRVVGLVLALLSVVLAHLFHHGPINQGKCKPCLVIPIQQIKARPHALYGQAHALDDTTPGPVVFGRQV